MTRGSWWLLDSANTCSAIVLDRLNCLVEEGGKLVVGERGMLEAQVVIVPRHENFRVFYCMTHLGCKITCYEDKSCGDSRVLAGFDSWDTQQLVFAKLGTAVGSTDAVARGGKIIKEERGLQDKQNPAGHTLAGFVGWKHVQLSGC